MPDLLAIAAAPSVIEFNKMATRSLLWYYVVCAVPVNDIDSSLLDDGTLIFTGTAPQSEGVSRIGILT